MIFLAGQTSRSVYFQVVEDSGGTNPGEPKTGMIFSDFEAGSYARNGAARVAITMATLASASAAYSVGGLILVDDTNMPGLYRFDIPDGAIATGVESVVIHLRPKAAQNAIAAPLEITLNIEDAVWDVLRSAHATASTFGQGPASVQGNVTGSVASVTGAVGSVTGAVGSVTGNVGGNVVGNVNGNVVGTVASVVGNVGGNIVGNINGNVVGTVASVVGAVGSVTGDVGGLAAAAQTDVEDAVWDAARASHVVASSFGQGVASVQGNVTGTVASVVGNVGGNVVGTVASVVGNVAGNVTGTIGGLTTAAQDEVGDAVWDEALAGHATGGSAGLKLTDIVADITQSSLTPELAAVPSATPTLEDALLFIFMALRNKVITDTTDTKLHNDAGTAIATATVTDAAGVFTRDKFA